MARTKTQQAPGAPYTFDAYTDKVSRRSGRWATSDRGWMYPQGSDHCVGFYLAYDAIPHYRKAYILAVVYDRKDASNTCNQRHTACATVAEAQAWMIAQHPRGLQQAA